MKTAVVAMDGHLCLSCKGMPARSARFDLRKKVKPTEAFLVGNEERDKAPLAVAGCRT